MPVNSLVALNVERPAVYLSPVGAVARVIESKGEVLRVAWVFAKKGELDGWYFAHDFKLYAS